MRHATKSCLMSCGLDSALEAEGGFSGHRSRSLALEPGTRLFDCQHLKRTLGPCQHGRRTYECKECQGIAAAAYEGDPAYCALPESISTWASPREPGGNSPRMAAPPAPPCALLYSMDQLRRTDSSTRVPGEVASTPVPSTLASRRSAQAIPAPAPALPATPTAAFSLFDADGSSGRSSSACGSLLHDLLQGGSRCSLLSATTTTSSSGAAPCAIVTEAQMLAGQLADTQRQLQRSQDHVFDLEGRNAALSHQIRLLRQQQQRLDQISNVLDGSVVRNEAELQRKDDTIEVLRRQVQELTDQVDQLKGSARASPTTSPPTDSLRTPEELALQVKGAIAIATEQLFCALAGVTPIRELVQDVTTDPSRLPHDSRVELLKAEPKTADCTSSSSSSSNSSSGPTAYAPGTKSVWKVKGCAQQQQQQPVQQQVRKQKGKPKGKQQRKQQQQQKRKQPSVATVPTFIVKVKPFHSSQRIQELRQGTFTAAHTSSGLVMTVPVSWEEASKEVVTATAMDRAAQHCSLATHGPFLPPLQSMVRPCSLAGGSLDVGYDLELVEVYEYCAGGDALAVVEEAAGDVLRSGGSVKEAAAAGAGVAVEVVAGSLRQVQIVHRFGCVVSDQKPTNMVYHAKYGWILIDSEGAVLLGPTGWVPGRGCFTDFYGAPEQMRKQDPYRSRASDVWAVGRTASALIVIIEEACRAAGEQQHKDDWLADVHEGMGETLGKLQRLEAACCVQEPAKRATLAKARVIMGV